MGCKLMVRVWDVNTSNTFKHTFFVFLLGDNNGVRRLCMDFKNDRSEGQGNHHER